jgi:hypothetical protein
LITAFCVIESPRKTTFLFELVHDTIAITNNINIFFIILIYKNENDY